MHRLIAVLLTLSAGCSFEEKTLTQGGREISDASLSDAPLQGSDAAVDRSDGSITPAIDCLDLATIRSDFENDQVPSGFTTLGEPQFEAGELIFSFSSPESPGAFQPKQKSLISPRLQNFQAGRAVLFSPFLEPNSGTQISLKIEQYRVSSDEPEILAEYSRVPGSDFLRVKQGTNEQTMFDSRGAPFISLSIETDVIRAEYSNDGDTWTLGAELDGVDLTDVILKVEGAQYSYSSDDASIRVDELNTLCLTP